MRPATREDIPEILALLEEFVRQQLVLPRTPEEMAENYRNFVVACRQKDGTLVGVGALRPHGEGLFEVRSLAVPQAYHGQGIGSRIVEALLQRARNMTPPARCVFTLTKRPAFFRNLGFRLAPKEDFPAKIWTDCRLCPKYHCCDEIALRREP
ncbi:MAG: GNAT family N-acetyltransferase [Oligosphaeraceae bacterium]